MKWAPIIPLVGGFPIGAEQALGTKPEAVLSYSAFDLNDSFYMYYQNTIKNQNLKRVKLEEEKYDMSQLDLVVATCPCAGLSALSRGSAEVKDNVNEWLFRTTEEVLSSGVKVLTGENAPNLYSSAGAKVAKRLKELGEKYDYSLTLYQTNSQLHGIPQNRKRTFYIFWKQDETPILEWCRKDRLNIKEYLGEVDNSLWGGDRVCDNSLERDPYFRMLTDKYGSQEAAYTKITEHGSRSALYYVVQKNLIDEINEWVKSKGSERDKEIVAHFKKKKDQDKGVWDGSVKCFGDVCPAIIGRNIANGMHPTEFRPFTFREVLHLMSFPDDFEMPNDISDRRFNKMLAQNVPVKTGQFIIEQIKLALDKKLFTTPSRYVKQNNNNKTFTEEETTSLQEFLT